MTRSPQASRLALPFLWGAATSAHQVEGGNDANDWYDWETRADSICVEPSGTACDHLHRFRDDIALLAELGLNCYRFSIEWSRVEPEPGRYSERALAHYRAVLESCREHGLMALVTLHHFTNPRWLAADGGWEDPATAGHFAAYCRFVLENLGELFSAAITVNEPNIAADGGWEVGTFPPGKRDREARIRVSENFAEGHRQAREAIRAVMPRLPLGLALAMADWQALPGGERELDEVRYLREDMFLAATEGDDFVGVNTYTRHRIGPEGWVGNEAGRELTAAGYEFWPEALEQTLRRAWSLTGGTPLIVTETGVATDDDTRRIAYIDRALEGMRNAIADGVDVRGFLYWSALDNFEWHFGYAQRFGLIAVDRETQVRTVKPSARHLGAIAQAATSYTHARGAG